MLNIGEQFWTTPIEPIGRPMNHTSLPERILDLIPKKHAGSITDIGDRYREAPQERTVEERIRVMMDRHRYTTEELDRIMAVGRPRAQRTDANETQAATQTPPPTETPAQATAPQAPPADTEPAPPPAPVATEPTTPETAEVAPAETPAQTEEAPRAHAEETAAEAPAPEVALPHDQSDTVSPVSPEDPSLDEYARRVELYDDLWDDDELDTQNPTPANIPASGTAQGNESNPSPRADTSTETAPSAVDSEQNNTPWDPAVIAQNFAKERGLPPEAWYDIALEMRWAHLKEDRQIPVEEAYRRVQMLNSKIPVEVVRKLTPGQVRRNSQEAQIPTSPSPQDEVSSPAKNSTRLPWLRERKPKEVNPEADPDFELSENDAGRENSYELTLPTRQEVERLTLQDDADTQGPSMREKAERKVKVAWQGVATQAGRIGRRKVNTDETAPPAEVGNTAPTSPLIRLDRSTESGKPADGSITTTDAEAISLDDLPPNELFPAVKAKWPLTNEYWQTQSSYAIDAIQQLAKRKTENKFFDELHQSLFVQLCAGRDELVITDRNSEIVKHFDHYRRLIRDNRVFREVLRALYEGMTTDQFRVSVLEKLGNDRSISEIQEIIKDSTISQDEIHNNLLPNLLKFYQESFTEQSSGQKSADKEKRRQEIARALDIENTPDAQ